MGKWPAQSEDPDQKTDTRLAVRFGGLECMNITFYLKKILVKLYLRKTKCQTIRSINYGKNEYFRSHLIVDPYKSRFFFFSSLPGMRNYCSSNLLFILNLRKKGHFYKVFYIFKKKIYCIKNQESLRESTSVIFCLNFGGWHKLPC